MKVPYVQPYHREKQPTELDRWMREKGMSNIALAQMVKCSDQTVAMWRQGKMLPSLAFAFKLERATMGAIPAVYWIDTPLGRKEWGACEL